MAVKSALMKAALTSFFALLYMRYATQTTHACSPSEYMPAPCCCSCLRRTAPHRKCKQELAELGHDIAL
eukprot:scaffold164465_cov18-Tisochrysis_lutea.AAC.2